MKKIGISTFCVWTSYGSILQSYALKHILQSEYNSFVLIDEKERNPYSVKICFKSGIKKLALDIYYLLIRSKIINQYKKTHKFLSEYMDLQTYDNYPQLLSNPPIADYYLSGSDQVFNPLNSRPSFFLDFIEDKSKCFTYACSMGVLNVPEKKEADFKRLINNFSRISVREEDNIPVLKRYNPDAEYYRHIDPTFLLSVDAWRNIESEFKIKGKYILVYLIYWDKEYNAELKKLHEKTGLPIIAVCSGYMAVYANKKLFDVGVQEFLWLIDHAEAVVTSSFHGVALSIIFNKKMSIIINPNAPSRIQSLIDLLSIKSLEIENLIDGEMDYAKANERIKEEQSRSFEYLEGLFNSEE